MNERVKRVSAAVVVALTGALAAPLSAAASTAIDPTERGTLTICKHLVPQGASITAGRPVEGATFSVARVVGIDLTTTEGWRAAQELSTSGPLPTSLEPTVSARTDGGGCAVFANLALGLYVVEEAPPQVGVDPVDPFLVSIPIPDPDNQGVWDYDVEVYPKNAPPGDTSDPPPPQGGVAGGGTQAPGTEQGGDRTPPAALGVTGAETGMLSAIAVGLLAAGVWLTVVGRLRRRDG